MKKIFGAQSIYKVSKHKGRERKVMQGETSGDGVQEF